MQGHDRHQRLAASDNSSPIAELYADHIVECSSATFRRYIDVVQSSGPPTFSYLSALAPPATRKDRGHVGRCRCSGELPRDAEGTVEKLSVPGD